MEAARNEFIMVSQWAIGENERAIKLFETLKNGTTFKFSKEFHTFDNQSLIL